MSVNIIFRIHTLFFIVIICSFLLFIPSVSYSFSLFGPSWSEEEKKEVCYFLRSYGTVRDTTALFNNWHQSNSTPDFKLLISRHASVLKDSEMVSDRVLDKIHPNLKKHYRHELVESSNLAIKYYTNILFKNKHINIQTTIKSSALHDKFGDFFQSKAKEFKMPKRIMSYCKETNLY